MSGWQLPETAPRDGTVVLGDFGYPWPIMTMWDGYDEKWAVATVQACPMEGGRTNAYFETDTEDAPALRQWHPLPEW